VLRDNRIHHNKVSGPGGKTGLATTSGGNLAALNIVFASNTFSKGMKFCHTSC
jgi:hypothetical protein